jgi:lysophospholipase L1-like esterase
MRLSISNSKSGPVFYAKVLAGICALLIVTLEIVADYLLKHHSETFTRVSQQYADAVRVRPAKAGEPISVLMVGNSLLLEGVEVDRLQKLTSSQMRIYPIFLEATGYYDWLYGLQRLFREGSRPQVVVLGVGVNSFLADSVRQDYVPLMLFDRRDTLRVASDLELDRTATSNLLLAHCSVFWDTRSALRTQILYRAVPRSKELFSLLKRQPPVPPAAEFQNIANSRLQRLHELCESYGAKLIILVPPTPSSEDAVREMTIAAQRARVETLVPIDPAALSTRYYQPDELHLNSEGAQLFTSALATFLPQTVDHEQVASPN